MKEFFIKSKTVTGDYAKQYFSLNTIRDFEVLTIRRMVLTSDKHLAVRGNIMKIYKDKFLLYDVFHVRLDTLRMAITAIEGFKVLDKHSNN